MLGRKKSLSFHLKIWNLLPARSLRRFHRDFMYHWHRLNRIKGSTRQISLGFAIGSAVSVTPFLGAHIFIGTLLAVCSRGSLPAMFLGTIIFGNPWTIPIIFWLNKKIGSWFLDISILNATEEGLVTVFLNLLYNTFNTLLGKISIFDYLVVLHSFLIYLSPFLLGSIPLALFTFFFTFYALEETIVIYHSNRNKKRHLKNKGLK